MRWIKLIFRILPYNGQCHKSFFFKMILLIIIEMHDSQSMYAICEMTSKKKCVKICTYQRPDHNIITVKHRFFAFCRVKIYATWIFREWTNIMHNICVSVYTYLLKKNGTLYFLNKIETVNHIDLIFLWIHICPCPHVSCKFGYDITTCGHGWIWISEKIRSMWSMVLILFEK